MTIDTMPPPRRPLRMLAAVLLILCSLAVLSAVSAEAKVHHHTWDIAYHYKSHDCFDKPAVTINGESSGPTIHATQGDTVVVTVHNSLKTENTCIHWHGGIRQIGTPLADGTVGVTQCPILPGDTFTYRFVVDRPGTYFYHVHYGIQRVASLDGMLVVSEPDGGGVAEPFASDEDPSRNYWAACHVVARERNTTSSMAILSYAGNDPRAPPPTPPSEGPAWNDVRPRVEQSRSLAVAHPDHVVPVPPRPRRGLLVLNTIINLINTIINLGSPAMDPQAPPSVNNAPDVESKRVHKMIIPVCSPTVAAATALIVAKIFQKPSDAGDVAAAAPLYSRVGMTSVSLGLGVSVVLLIYSIVAESSRRPGFIRVLKAALAMSVTYVFGPFISCAVFMLALPWLFVVGAVAIATAMAVYLALTWKKEDDGAEGDRTRSGVDGANHSENADRV